LMNLPLVPHAGSASDSVTTRAEPMRMKILTSPDVDLCPEVGHTF